MVKKLTIEDMHKIAKDRGGKFISEKYINNQTKHSWQCSNGHTWEATPGSVKYASWCPYCAGKAKLTIEDMHSLAKSNGGKFLSEIYINSQTKHEWQCYEGHIWEAVPNSVQRGSWCSICSGVKKLTINDMREFAEKKGGKFICEEYISNEAKHKWQCNKGHIREVSFSKIKNGNLCLICNGYAKLTTENVQDYAKIRGGKFLSEKHTNSATKEKWECANGHVWMAKLNHIKQGSWCPFCIKSSRGEEICRMVLTKMFDETFIKCRPHFLKNKKTLELDGFCKELNIAFEYQGRQHFESVNCFGGKKEFLKIQNRDKIKLELCKIQGIKVIVVPTFPLNFDKFTCQAIIEHSVIKAGIEIPSTWIRAVDKMIDAA